MQRRPFMLTLLGLGVLALSQADCLHGCGKDESTLPAGTCASSDDCDDGYVCLLSECSRLCARDTDCESLIQSCQNGVCQEVQNPDCAADTDCDMPGPCELVIGATCRAGRCTYSARPANLSCDDGNPCTDADRCDGNGACTGIDRVCNNPPGSECIAGDTVFVTYGTPGVCDPLDGNCDYTVNQINCNNCATNCQAACAGVVCDDDRGGCQLNGFCDPTAPGSCSYAVQPDRSPCTLTGNEPGVCSGGDCVGCIDASDCTDLPGANPECFAVTCSGGVCDYAPQPTVECEPQSCTGGVITRARTCGVDGLCPDGGGASCGGYQCDSGGTSCLTACTGSMDCLAPLVCNAPACEGLLPDDDPCTSNGQCVNICLVDTCRPQSVTGGQCDETADCLGGHTCAGTTCLKNNGETCMDNSECDAVCRQGTCRPLGGQGAGCDEPADCSQNLTCATDNTCKLDLGVSCMSGGECNTGFCADGVCCENACSGNCRSCGNDGLCNDTPNDDPGCGTISCDSLDTTCRDFSSINTNRCDGFGMCVTPGDPEDCTQSTPRNQGTVCNTCTACSASGACDQIPANNDDSACGTVSCSGLDTTCRSYDDYTGTTGNRCKSVGSCRQVNAADCQSFTNETGVCNAATDDCDVAEFCSGGSCPSDQKASAGTLCDNTADCKSCDGMGNCNQTPADDAGCGTIQCSNLTTTCRIYTDYDGGTGDRCASFGSCRAVNTSDCQMFSNTTASCGNCLRCSGGACGNAPINEDCGFCGACDGMGSCFGNCSGDTCCERAMPQVPQGGICISSMQNCP